MDTQLLQNLLDRQESDNLDFKSRQYKLESTKDKANFIKDVVSMANTPRDEPAYIVLGVSEAAGKATTVPGVFDHHDQSELGRIISAVVTPTPRFTYQQILYEGKQLGIIEIAIQQPRPIMAIKDYGVLRKSVIYIRRNTQNIEATGEEIARIYEQPSEFTFEEEGSLNASWAQIYRACDGFDPRRAYIAVLGSESRATEQEWSQLAKVPWALIVDFDASTDINGNYAVAQDEFSTTRSLRLTALDDSPLLTNQSTVWVAAAGLESRPTTSPTTNWRDWNRTKSQRLERIFSDLARCTEPAPVSVVLLGGEPNYAKTICEICDRVFSYRANYVVAVADLETYDEVVELFDAEAVQINITNLCHGIRETLSDITVSAEVELPTLGGGFTSLAPDRARWIEEQFEFVRLHQTTPITDPSVDSSFLSGAIVSWKDLNEHVDVDREITAKLEREIRRQLISRATRRLNLWHWPGAGATTVARRIAWNLQHDFPTVIASEITPLETSERLRHIFGITQLPVLVIVDLPQVTKDVADRLYDSLRSAHTPALLLNVERRFQTRSGATDFYLDAMLTTREAVKLAETLGRRVPHRQSDLKRLIDQPDRRKRSPFYFGLVAYGRDFSGLESFVSARLAQASETMRAAILMSSFAYYYGQTPLSLQLFAPLFNIPASTLVNMKVLPDYIRELIVEDNYRIRPGHYLIAEEILHQALGEPGRDIRNWRIGLADLAISFIDLLADLPHQERGGITSILRAVLIERGSTESPAGPWESEFSRFLTDIPTPEGRQRVLEHLAASFSEEPHFWAHLGRFYSRTVRDHEKAHQANQRALALVPNDTLLHHMAGMGWRADLYDLFGSVGDNITKDKEERIQYVLREAAREFETARGLDKRSEYNYISQLQMILRTVGTVSAASGYRHQPMHFLALHGNAFYRELIDEAQNLLSDLTLIKGDEAPSQLQASVQADLEKLHGKHSEAIQRLTNVLDRNESYRPPLRRAIIRAYIGKYRDDWNQLTDRELSRVVQLATQNIDEEPGSDYNLRLWLRAIRAENTLSIDRVSEQLAYKRLQNPSVDTTYYLYIMKFLQLESGDLAAAREIPRLMEECTQLARDLARTTTSFEWLGQDGGLASIVHVSTLGSWDVAKAFWPKTESLRIVRGRIAEIRNQGNGEIELPSGLRAFFIPSRGAVPGGYLSGQDIGREVEFFLGFSYDGLRAWSVRDAT